MGNKRVFILLSILTALLSILIVLEMSQSQIPITGMRNTFDATCIVGQGNIDLDIIIPMGTGVVLDTGFILTARHVVDMNGNGKIDAKEREFLVQFKYGNLFRVRLAYIGEKDFALLMPYEDFSLRPSVKAANRNARLAEKIHTVGATAGQSLSVTAGNISMPYQGRGRASCFISGGNSGGGIISEDDEHLGVAVAVGIRHQFLTAQSMLKIEDKLYFSTTQIHIRDEVGSLCFYVPIHKIRSELASKNLAQLIDVQPQPALLDSLYGPFMSGGLQLIYQLFLFLWATFYVRRHLFG